MVSSPNIGLPVHRLLIFGACLAGGLLGGAEMRSLEPYRVDPLTESWRWQRLEGLEGKTMDIVEMGPDGNLVVVQVPNEILTYDGLSWKQMELPEGFSGRVINALHVSSRGHYCVVTNEAVFLFDGKSWDRIAETGMSRRAWDNIIETRDGILWIGIDAGVVRLDPVTKDFRMAPSPAAVLSLCEGPDLQSIWVATAPRGEIWECPIRNGNLVPADQWVRRKSALQHEILAISLMRASDGRIWQINNHHNLPA
ncbi:MAG TPA: hypothetical protein VK995_03585, partial [Oceanipulchritudo sp.]|nr:hypothetical protein [Oceanipulchritudo sp.]